MIPLFKVFMSDTASIESSKVLESGFIGQGPVVDNFESDLKEWFQIDYLFYLPFPYKCRSIFYSNIQITECIQSL